MQYTHKTERTDLGCKRGRSTNLTTGRPEVDDLDFVGVLQLQEITSTQEGEEDEQNSI
jgi:hypothetical protein